MQIDPTKWLVAFAGFAADWVISREWKRILLCLLPLVFLATVSGLVFWGSRLNKSELAQWYLELGEGEIAEWQDSWAAPELPAETNQEKPKLEDKSQLVAVKTADAETGESRDESRQISRFAEVLFRRVQLLEPNNRSQFVIGVTLAQRGATSQARRMLNKIAPDDRSGYAPAHAWLALSMLKQPKKNEVTSTIMHHLKIALTWDRVPEFLLLAASQLYWQLGEQDESLRMMERASERNSKYTFTLAQQAKEVKNSRIFEQAIAKAEALGRSKLAMDEYDSTARLHLAKVLTETSKFDEAEKLIRDGMKLAESPEYTRGLSEIYRLRFVASLKQEGEGWSSDVQMLDVALRTDPTNPLVVEEIAKLARLIGKSPSEELMQKLLTFLAEGKATAVTHAWLSDIHLLEEDFKKALPHLEQVVNRLPNAAQYANNLAYVLVEIAPERIDEALQLAERAVNLSNARVGATAFDVHHAADYVDTLAIVLAKLGRHSEAITALESAIERQPNRSDFHERLAEYYEITGNATLSELHRQLAEKIKAAQSLPPAPALETEPAEPSGLSEVTEKQAEESVVSQKINRNGTNGQSLGCE